MKKRKLWLLISGIIVVICILMPSIIFFRDYSFQNPDELWPENGKVIAIIDGREYRYDPVYLFRLTNCVFPDNEKQDSRDIIDFGLGGTDTPGLTREAGSTLEDNALLLELCYIDNKPYLGQMDEFFSTRQIRKAWRNHMKYSKINSSPYDNKDSDDDLFLKMYNKAKFYKWQPYNNYMGQVEPYVQKFYIISFGGMPIDQEEYNKLLEGVDTYGKTYWQIKLEALKAKYNVKMMD